MSCDVKQLVVQFMCVSMYWLHTRNRSLGKMIPKIIFILFVNLIMDSPADILLDSKEQLYYLYNELLASVIDSILNISMSLSKLFY